MWARAMREAREPDQTNKAPARLPYLPLHPSGMTIDPQTFFDEFVRPSLDEAWSEPHSVRRAIVAICELDNLAEHFLLRIRPGINRQQLSEARDYLATQVPALGVIRDVHDTHKHGNLHRRTARISQGQRPSIDLVGGMLGFGPFGGAPLGGFMEELIISLDDGTRHYLKQTLNEAFTYWSDELRKLQRN